MNNIKYDKFGKRLKQSIDKNGFEESKLADKLGLTRQTVYNWTYGKSVPGYDTLIELSKILKVSLDYLMRGVTYTSVIDSSGQTRPIAVSLRPVYSSLHFDEDTRELTGVDPVGEYLYNGTLSETSFLFNVNKNNMSSIDPLVSINKGDIVLIDSSRKESHGDIVLILDDTTSINIYQIFYEDNDFILLRSLNNFYSSYRIKRSNLRFIVPVIEVIPRPRKLI